MTGSGEQRAHVLRQPLVVGNREARIGDDIDLLARYLSEASNGLLDLDAALLRLQQPHSIDLLQPQDAERAQASWQPLPAAPELPR